MKIVEKYQGDGKPKARYPYLATHKGTGAIVLLSRHGAVIIKSDRHEPGDAWLSHDGSSLLESNFEPFPVGYRMTLENE